MPNDGIHWWSSTNWYCAPAGSNSAASTTAITSTASDSASARYLASAAGGRRQQDHHGRPEHRHGPQDGQPRHAVHQTLTTRMAPTTRAAPPSIDSAYERANPVCNRPNRSTLAPTTPPRPPRHPVDGVVVDLDEAGRQLLAGPHEDVLVERVAVEVVAGGDGQCRHLLGRGLGNGSGGVHAVGDRDARGDHRERDGRHHPGRHRVVGLVGADDGFEPVLQRAADRQQATRTHRADGEHDHRPGHRRRAIRADALSWRFQRFSPKNVITITRVM